MRAAWRHTVNEYQDERSGCLENIEKPRSYAGLAERIGKLLKFGKLAFKKVPRDRQVWVSIERGGLELDPSKGWQPATTREFVCMLWIEEFSQDIAGDSKDEAEQLKAFIFRGFSRKDTEELQRIGKTAVQVQLDMIRAEYERDRESMEEAERGREALARVRELERQLARLTQELELEQDENENESEGSQSVTENVNESAEITESAEKAIEGVENVTNAHAIEPAIENVETAKKLTNDDDAENEWASLFNRKLRARTRSRSRRASNLEEEGMLCPRTQQPSSRQQGQGRGQLAGL